MSYRDMFACQKCGEEYGAGEEMRGKSPCCMREGDPIGSIEICDAPLCGNPMPCSEHPELGLEANDGR